MTGKVVYTAIMMSSSCAGGTYKTFLGGENDNQLTVRFISNRGNKSSLYLCFIQLLTHGTVIHTHQQYITIHLSLL